MILPNFLEKTQNKFFYIPKIHENSLSVDFTKTHLFYNSCENRRNLSNGLTISSIIEIFFCGVVWICLIFLIFYGFLRMLIIMF